MKNVIIDGIIYDNLVEINDKTDNDDTVRGNTDPNMGTLIETILTSSRVTRSLHLRTYHILSRGVMKNLKSENIICST